MPQNGSQHLGNGEKLEAPPLKPGTKQGVRPVHSSSLVPGFLLEQNKRREIAGNKKEKEDIQVSSFAYLHMTWLHTEVALKTPPEKS